MLKREFKTCVTQEMLQHLPCVSLHFDGGVELQVPPTAYFQLVEGATCLSFFITEVPIN